MRIEARNAAEVARASLNSLIGLPLDTDVELTTSAEAQAPLVPAGEPPASGDAAAGRADLLAAGLRIEASELGVKAAKAGLYPQVFLTGNYYYLRPNSRYLPARDEFKGTWDVSLSVSFDIWNWGQTKSRAEQAKAQLAQAKDARKLLENQAALEVTQSRLALDRAGDMVRVAGQAVAQAEENLGMIRERFRQGVALNSDVLDADVALLRARMTRTQAAIDLVLARARLDKALGR